MKPCERLSARPPTRRPVRSFGSLDERSIRLLQSPQCLETQDDRNLSTGFKTGFIYVNWGSHGAIVANQLSFNLTGLHTARFEPTGFYFVFVGLHAGRHETTGFHLFCLDFTMDAIHLHIAPRLKMSGTIPPLPLYDFMRQTGTALPLRQQAFIYVGWTQQWQF